MNLVALRTYATGTVRSLCFLRKIKGAAGIQRSLLIQRTNPFFFLYPYSPLDCLRLDRFQSTVRCMEPPFIAIAHPNFDSKNSGSTLLKNSPLLKQ
jgi:hypothetical protein